LLLHLIELYEQINDDDDDDDDESKAIAVFRVSRHPQLRGPQSLQWPQTSGFFWNILKTISGVITVLCYFDGPRQKTCGGTAKSLVTDILVK